MSETVRTTVAPVLALLLTAAAASPARADEPGIEAPQSDEEPGLKHAETAVGGRTQTASGWGKLFAPRERGPRVQFGYRSFTVADMERTSPRYHCVAIDVYPYSGYLRTGIGLEGGADSTEKNNLLLTGQLMLGVQYPSNVTPYAELIWGAGFLRRDLFNEDLFSFIQHFGLDAGIAVFASRYLLVSVAIGWRRQVFRFAGNDQVGATSLYFDSFATKISIGL